MPYPELMVKPMREELTSLGVEELKTPDEVESFMDQTEGTSMLVINSVCGCAAGMARPAVRLLLEGDALPTRSGTVFAGQDVEATAKARSYMEQVPPSSPSMAIFKDGELAFFLPRHRIEGREAVAIANDLSAAFTQLGAEG